MLTDLTELERLYAAATPGVWFLSDNYDDGCFEENVYTSICPGDITRIAGGAQSVDRALIVALHNAVPALVAELKAGRQLRDRVVAALGKWSEASHDDMRACNDAENEITDASYEYDEATNRPKVKQ